MRLDTILVPTDFSRTADHALAQTMELAVRHGSQLHLFHVVEPYGEPPPNMMAAVRDYLDELEKKAQRALVSKADALRAQGVEVQFSSAHHVAPSEAIADKATGISADLIVMGTHGRRGLQHMLLGSVAEKVLRSVPVSVLTLSLEAPLVRSERMFQRVLVPVDFSDCSRRALDAAFSLLAEDGTLRVVHVVDNPVYPSFYPGLDIASVQLGPELRKKDRRQPRGMAERENG